MIPVTKGCNVTVTIVFSNFISEILNKSCKILDNTSVPKYNAGSTKTRSPNKPANGLETPERRMNG